MAERQHIFREDTIIETLNLAYHDMKEGLFSESIERLEKILEIDIGYPGASSSRECAAFWRDRQEKDLPYGEGFDKGESLLSQWKLFIAHVARLSEVPERCLFSIKQYVFSSALSYFIAACGSEEDVDPDLLLRIGRCYKGIGNYERALDALERANAAKRENAAILAELADCCMLVSEARAAKAFFREAFFIDPQAVDISLLESPAIGRLAAKLREMGFSGPELLEWIPVYGTIYGIFTVKRELTPLELGKLKQSIYQLEKAVRGGAGRHLAPRLINRYFWLIDHYMMVGEPRERLEEVLAKIREIDPRVHREYTT